MVNLSVLSKEKKLFLRIFSLNPEAVTLKKLWQKSCNLRRENIAILQAKGQLISKGNFGVFKSIKKPTNIGLFVG